MNHAEILQLGATQLSAAIREGRTTAPEALEAVLEQIRRKEPDLHCYITVSEKRAAARAALVQEKIEAGELTGPLAGVPVAVKDNLCTAGIRTTCGSKMLEQFVPYYSAEAVKRLEDAGAILVGKTNLDEFAMGSTTETSYFGATKNPYNPAHTPGGSSGGSAAALAARECFLALGTDTGGSVRQPASHCGVIGMKPTYGRISRYGLVAYASSMDQVGVLCKSGEDCAAALQILSGHDPKDSTSVCRQVEENRKQFNEDLKGLRIGVPKQYLEQGLEADIKAAVLETAEVYRSLGAKVELFDMNLTEYVVPTYYTIACAEASSNLERFDGVKYGFRDSEATELHQMYRRSRAQGFGMEVKRRILAGSFVLSAGYYDEYYRKALKVRQLLKKEYDRVFASYDCVLGPTAPTTAPRAGFGTDSPLQMYLQDIYTTGANLAGVPAISVPCGRDHRGLPIGFQLQGNLFCEDILLQAVQAYERAMLSCGKGKCGA